MSQRHQMAAAATLAGAQGAAAPAAAATGTPGSGSTVHKSQGVLIGDQLYSGGAHNLGELSPAPQKAPLHAIHVAWAPHRHGVGPPRELIQVAGLLLHLPQVAMATGQVLFQRFFYTKSFVKHSMEHVTMGWVHLASKIEEAPRRIRDVTNVFHGL